MRLIILMVSSALLATSSFADFGAPAQKRELYSQSKEYLVKIFPGNSIGDTVGFAGSPKGEYARAEVYKLGNDGKYTLSSKMKLVNPVAPVDCFVTDYGYLVTLDNWHNCGYGKIVASYSPNGDLINSFELKDLFNEIEMALFQRLSSSISWRKWNTQHFKYVYVREDQKVLFIQLNFNQALLLDIEQGAVEGKIVSVPEDSSSKIELDQSKLQLELSSPSRMLRLDTQSKLQLKVVGNWLQEIKKGIQGAEGAYFDDSNKSALIYEFTFHPQKEGTYTFGPYTFSINGQELISNQFSMRVLPRWDGQSGTFYNVDKNLIALGESVEFAVETWSTNRTHRSFHFKENGYDSNRIGYTGGLIKGDLKYQKQTWLIEPKEAGEFQINKDIFWKFPEDIVPPAITIMVMKENPNQNIEPIVTTPVD